MTNQDIEQVEPCVVLPIHNISLSTVEDYLRVAKSQDEKEALLCLGVDLTDKILICQFRLGENNEPLLCIGYGPKSLARDKIYA